MIEAKNRGFGVSKPFGDNERYDLILDGGQRRLWRVQVKSSASVHHNGFAVRACWRSSRKHLPYTAALIDFMAVVIQSKRVPERLIWYVIPVRALGGRLTINLYPFGGRRDCELRLEKYRDAWGLLGRARRRRRVVRSGLGGIALVWNLGASRKQQVPPLAIAFAPARLE